MVTYDNLPVYKISYDLLIQTFEIVTKFNKQYKYTLGDKIKNEIINLITSIYKANSSFENRGINIKKAREQIEVLRLYIRLSKDLKLISIKEYASISLQVESLSKQLFAWSKANQK